MHQQSGILTPRQMDRLQSKKTGEYFFDYVPFAMLASDAWLGMTAAAQCVVWRLFVEHGLHRTAKTNSNGKLRVTWNHFERWGIPRKRLAGAIELAKQLGFVAIVPGQAGCGNDRRTSEYGLTFLPWHDGKPPFHTWATADSSAKGRASREDLETKRNRRAGHLPNNMVPPKMNGAAVSEVRQ